MIEKIDGKERDINDARSAFIRNCFCVKWWGVEIPEEMWHWDHLSVSLIATHRPRRGSPERRERKRTLPDLLGTRAQQRGMGGMTLVGEGRPEAARVVSLYGYLYLARPEVHGQLPGRVEGQQGPEVQNQGKSA